MPLLAITDLAVEYPTRFGTVTAIADVDLTLEPGQIHGLVGESGAGKSTVGAAVMGLIDRPGRIARGSIRLRDEELTALDDDAWHRLRGRRIAMIFQDPLTSLDPLFTIEDQLVETIRHHRSMSAEKARQRALGLLAAVGIDDAEERIGDYPHQFSGGMRQRVVIALAIASEPEVIIADEPTTALDVAVHASDHSASGYVVIFTLQPSTPVMLSAHGLQIAALVVVALLVLTSPLFPCWRLVLHDVAGNA